MRETLPHNWYLPKATNVADAILIAEYGKVHDPLGWDIDDSGRYHLVKFGDRKTITGYGKAPTYINKTFVELTIQEFKVLVLDEKLIEVKEISISKIDAKLLNNIETILLKNLGEQEVDDIINELKQLL